MIAISITLFLSKKEKKQRIEKKKKKSDNLKEAIEKRWKSDRTCLNDYVKKCFDFPGCY